MRSLISLLTLFSWLLPFPWCGRGFLNPANSSILLHDNGKPQLSNVLMLCTFLFLKNKSKRLKECSFNLNT